MTDKSEQKKWNYTLNSVKLLAAVFVVFIHCQFPTRFGQIIKNTAQFSVPVFFMISGYFSANIGNMEKQIGEKYCRRICKIILLIIFSNILYCFYEICRKIIIVGENQNQILEWLKDTIAWRKWPSILLLNESIFSTHLWFLQALLYCYLFWVFLGVRMSPKALYGTAALLFMMHFGYNAYSGYSVQMIRNAWFYGIPCFILGIFLKNVIKEKISFSKISLIIYGSLAFLIMLVESSFFRNRILYIGNVAMASVLFIYAQRNSGERENVAAYLGRTISDKIYIFHPIFIYVVFKVFDLLRLSDFAFFKWIHPLLTVLVSVVFSLSIVFLKVFGEKIRYERDHHQI